MKNSLPRLGVISAIVLLTCTPTAFAATFSELDTDGDDILSEQEFIDALGPHHGTIAYGQYNTDADPIVVQTVEEVQATDADGNLMFEQGAPVMVEMTDADGNTVLVQATDAEGNLLFEQGAPIMETVVTETLVEGVTMEEIRRSRQGFERSTEGKARAFANKERASERRGEARGRSERARGEKSRGGNGRNK